MRRRADPAFSKGIETKGAGIRPTISSKLLRNIVSYSCAYCVVPENIHTPTTQGQLEIPVVGGLTAGKFLKGWEG